jgi:hypothetical protein
MANLAVWYYTDIPPELVDLVERDLVKFDENMAESRVGGGGRGAVETAIRNSKNTWVPAGSWIGSFCLNYVNRANAENFRYDVTGFDNENMQYTSYGPGEYYNWHQDSDIDTCAVMGNTRETAANDFVTAGSETIRKLSFVLQLSDYTEYGGGELQFHHGERSWFAPKKRGAIVVFDSRVFHRVKRVTHGHRKSIVGWVMGPRWK